MSEEDLSRIDAALSSDNHDTRKAAEEEVNRLIRQDDWQDDELDDLREFSRFTDTTS